MQFTMIDQSLIDRRIERNQKVTSRTNALKERIENFANRISGQTLDGGEMTAEPVYANPAPIVQTPNVEPVVQAISEVEMENTQVDMSDEFLDSLLNGVNLDDIGLEQ